jgi:ribosomal protein S12 methylthiotransferase accessory factor
MSESLRSQFINPGTEALAYRLDETEYRGMEEILATYSPLAGPVSRVSTYFGMSGGLPIHVGHTEYYDLDYVLQRITGQSALDTGVSRSLFAGGKGYDLHGMFISSVGEAVERIVGSLHFFENAQGGIYGSHRELNRQGLRSLSPEELPLFSPEQYADPDFMFEPFTADSHLGWVEGERLISGEKVWVPAQLVELVYSLRQDEAVIGYSASGGLSSHVSRTKALVHGIVELIERDALNLRWYCGVPPEKIELDRPSHHPSLERLLERSGPLPCSIDFYYHSIDIPEVPVVTAVQIDHWLTRFAYNSGGGAALDIDTAMYKALTELGQSERSIRLALLAPDRAFARGVEYVSRIGADDPVSSIDLFFKVISYYGYRKNLSKLDWYFKNNDEVPISSLSAPALGTSDEEYEYLLDVLSKHDIDPIVFDFTPSQMRQVRIVKVFIPELTQPFLQSLPIFGHPRFAKAARMLGKRKDTTTYEELTVNPLPFP